LIEQGVAGSEAMLQPVALRKQPRGENTHWRQRRALSNSREKWRLFSPTELR
jgi:hypothetical protein